MPFASIVWREVLGEVPWPDLPRRSDRIPHINMAKLHIMMILSVALTVLEGALIDVPQPYRLRTSKTNKVDADSQLTPEPDQLHYDTTLQSPSAEVINANGENDPQHPQYFLNMTSVFSAHLPRNLTCDDKVTVTGRISPDATEFAVILATGITLDKNDVPLVFHVNMTENKIFLSLTENGLTTEPQEERQVFSKGGNWDLTMEMNDTYITVIIDGSFHSSLDLKHHLSNITALHVTGHVCVKTLSFEFASEINSCNNGDQL